MELDNLPNLITFEAWCKCERHLIDHHKILISLSGGSDSDIMLDFITRVVKENKYDYDLEIRYIFFNTGIEYQATKEHLDYLENKYNIKIERIMAKTPVPLGCKLYGLPFLSKDISAKLNALQNNDFDFSNDGNKKYEQLIKKYKKCISVIKWWCNKKESFNIKDNKYLKEFMIENPPNFKISSRCCEGAKKTPSHEYEKENNIDLKCLGLRSAEGGIRSSAIHSCFNENENGIDDYRPIWWFTDKDKQEYKKFFNIKHSDCYEVWGMKRTGCAGCPFNSKFDTEIEVVRKYEPMLYMAINNIFGKSYEYTRAYRKYKKEKQRESKQLLNQNYMFDY